MAVQSSITIDKAQFDDLVLTLGMKDATRAARTAISKTLNNAKAIMAREVAKLINAPRKAVLGDKSRRTINTYMFPKQPEGVLSVNNNPIAAIRFNNVSPKKIIRPQAPGGVSVLFQQYKGQIQFHRAWIGRFKYDRRVGKGEYVTGYTTQVIGREKEKLAEPKRSEWRPSKRWPGKMVAGKTLYRKLYKMWGPSLINIVGAETLTTIGRDAVSKIETKLQQNLASQIDWLLDKQRKAAAEEKVQE
jgi:hypothetical protein